MQRAEEKARNQLYFHMSPEVAFIIYDGPTNNSNKIT